MSLPALPNVWKDCGFKSSPYFQDVLQESSDTKSLRLFVGREEEQRQLLTTIGSNDSSRQAVAGFPGVGKTTLVQAIKAEAKKANYCVADELISITPEDNSDALLGQLIAGIHDAIFTCKSNLKNRKEMKDARHFVEVTRQQNFSFGATLSEIGIQGSRSETVSSPIGGLALPSRHVIKNLLKLALDNGSNGVILHLNNLENLSESDTDKAAVLLRSVRDTGLMIDGLHLIIVGPTSAIRTVISHHRQIKNIFSPIINIKQLTSAEVYKLLENRYEALKIDPNKPFHKPIEDRIVSCLYEIFNGDLRGILKSLGYGVESLLSNKTDDSHSLPFTLDDFLPIIKKLSQNESEELQEILSVSNWKYIVNWADNDRNSIQTQESLLKMWDLKNVSTIMKELTTAGVVEILPSRADRKIQYSLTGSARLATLGCGGALHPGH